MRAVKEGMTLKYFMRFYLRHCRVRNTDGTLDTKRVYLRRYLHNFRGKRLREISRADVEVYIQSRAGAASNATINRELATLKALFNYAILLEYVKKNPVVGIRFLPEAHKPLNIPTFQEIMNLLTWCLEPNPQTGRPNDSLLYDLVTIAAMTGLRRGDILKIEGADIDLDRGLLRVAISKTGDEEYVPMNDTVARVLARRRGPGYIFVNGDTHLKSFRRRWRRAKCETGFAYRFHDLRHFAATEMLGNGADIMTVKYLLRHKRLETTQRYLAVVDTRARAAVETLNLPPATPRTATLPFGRPVERATGLEPATLSLEDRWPGRGMEARR